MEPTPYMRHVDALLTRWCGRDGTKRQVGELFAWGRWNGGEVEQRHEFKSRRISKVCGDYSQACVLSRGEALACCLPASDTRAQRRQREIYSEWERCLFLARSQRVACRLSSRPLAAGGVGAAAPAGVVELALGETHARTPAFAG